MNTKTIRIKEFSATAYTASLWPISDHFYTLQWDHWTESLTYSKKEVDGCFAQAIWTKIEETPSEESLPRTFKFKTSDCCKYDDLIYTYKESDSHNIFWENGESIRYPVESIRKYIAEGDWIVLSSEPEKKLDNSSLPLKITVDSEEANKHLAETISLAEKLGEAIKSLRKTLGTEFVTLNFEGIL